MKKILEGWSGGSYSDLAIHETKHMADIGIGNTASKNIFEEFYPFEGKRVRVTVEELEAGNMEDMEEYEALFVPGLGHDYISKRYNGEIGDEEAVRRAEKYSKDKGVPIYCVRKVRTSRRYLIHNMPF